jgi:hypothetical protein
MAMDPCSKCLENQWEFKLADAVTVQATCKLCGHEVQWSPKKLQRKAKRVYAPFAPHFSTDEIRNQPGPPPW